MAGGNSYYFRGIYEISSFQKKHQLKHTFFNNRKEAPHRQEGRFFLPVARYQLPCHWWLAGCGLIIRGWWNGLKCHPYYGGILSNTDVCSMFWKSSTRLPVQVNQTLLLGNRDSWIHGIIRSRLFDLFGRLDFQSIWYSSLHAPSRSTNL